MKLLQKIKEIIEQNSSNLRTEIQKKIGDDLQPLDPIFKAKLQESLEKKLRKKSLFSTFSAQWATGIGAFSMLLLFLVLNMISHPSEKKWSDNFFDKAMAYYAEEEKNKPDPNQIYYQKINDSYQEGTKTITFTAETWEDANGNRLAKDNFNQRKNIFLLKYNLADGTLERWDTLLRENQMNPEELKDFLNQVKNYEQKELKEIICLRNVPAGYISHIHIPVTANDPVYIRQVADPDSFQGPKAESNIINTLMNSRQEKNIDEIIDLFKLLKDDQNIEDNGEKQQDGKTFRVFTMWHQKPGYIHQGAMGDDLPLVYFPGKKSVFYFDTENYAVMKIEDFDYYEGVQTIATRSIEKQGYIKDAPDQIFNPQAYNLVKVGTDLYDLGCYKERKKMSKEAENEFMNNLSEQRKKEIRQALADASLRDPNQQE